MIKGKRLHSGAKKRNTRLEDDKKAKEIEKRRTRCLQPTTITMLNYSVWIAGPSLVDAAK